MRVFHSLPLREQVFVISLRRHGYRLTYRRDRLKRRKRYIIPASVREDASGIDFWIKPAKTSALIPIQVTQRGIAQFKRHHLPSEGKLEEFALCAQERLSLKQRMCRRARTAFVLVEDFCGGTPNPRIMWRDVKALNYALRHTCTAPA